MREFEITESRLFKRAVLTVTEDFHSVEIVVNHPKQGVAKVSWGNTLSGASASFIRAFADGLKRAADLVDEWNRQ